MLNRRAFLTALCLAGLALAGQPALADDDDVDQDDVMDQVQSGRILPLSTIRTKLAERVKGEIVRVKVTRDHGRVVYKLRLLTPDSRLVEAEIDAVTGVILEIENE